MGKIVERNLPCYDQVECQSSDARQMYEDGTSYCFSCGSFFPKGGKKEKNNNKMTQQKVSLEEVDTYEVRGFKERCITKKVAEQYKVKVSYDEKGEIAEHYYPYGVDKIVGYKIRKLPKQFYSTGKIKGLFGQLSFPSGGKRLVITEGELDAMSVAQAYLDEYQFIYPVVSLPSASGTKELLEQREWVRSFDEVVLMLDNDEAGKKSAKLVVSHINSLFPGKAKAIHLEGEQKDPSDYLAKKGKKNLLKFLKEKQLIK